MDTIAVIIAVSSSANQERIKRLFMKVKVLRDYKIEIYYTKKRGNTAAAYNKINRNIESKYKLYIREDISEMPSDWLIHLLRRRVLYGESFALGFLGSYLTINGDFIKKNKIYGSYRYIKNGEIISSDARGVLYRKYVHILDSAILFTNLNLMWDEDSGEYFYVAAYCSELRKVNVTPFVLEDTFRFEPVMGRCSDFENIRDEEEYRRELLKFNLKYRNLLRPLVSIGIPTYNNPRYLKLALESALNQDYDNLEIIVGDDSTNSDTKDFIQYYLLKYKNLKYINNGGPLGKKGGINGRNILNSCNGEYIQLLYHDDIIYPQKISTMMEIFIQDVEGNIGFVASGRNIIDGDGAVLMPYRNDDNLYERINGRSFGRKFFSCYQNYIGEQSTVLIRKKCLLLRNGEIDIGRYWGIKEWSLGDISTWLDICRKYDFIYVHEALSEFRFTSLDSQNSNDIEIINESKFDYLLMTVMAWLNSEYIHNEAELKMACISWQHIMYSGIELNFNDKISDAMKLRIELMQACNELINQNKIDVILDLIIRYLMSCQDNDVDLQRYCEYDEINDKWIKRRR